MTKHVAQTYQVLDEIEHIRKRTGMYAGSTAEQTSQEWVYDLSSKRMMKKEITYIPALVKIFSEILDNAIDESRRHPVESIRVTFEDTGEISVLDNGSGIPVEIHPQTNTYIAETVFSNLRAGSNFDDAEDQQLIGTNGVGASITNVLSTKFRVESCDGHKLFKQDFWNGMRERSEPVIKRDDKSRTKVTFTPDYKFFGLNSLTDGNRLRMIKKIVDAAACNLSVKFYINAERVLIRDFDDYISLYSEEFVSDSTPDWKVGISASDGFEQISFINSVETFQGGTHIDYVMIQITNAVREHIKKKHKIEVKPAEIRGHMRVYISANINRPKFSSQTKENMISSVGDYKTEWTVPDKMIRKILQSSIVQSILDWAEAKAHAEELKELRKLNKDVDKANPRRVAKFSDASEKHQRHRTVLFLAEGDSAAKSLFAAADHQFIGTFPLKGKPLNVREKEITRVLGIDKRKEGKTEPNEIQKILTILGLQIGVPVTSINDLRFGKVAFATDGDVDGAHISGLLMNLFDYFWPELFKMGFIHILRTPVVKVQLKDKKLLEFFTEREFKEWAASEGAKLKGWSHRYYKGLGSSKTQDFEPYMKNLNKYLFQVTMDGPEDKAAIDLAFNGERADDRKTWLETPAANFEDYIQS